MFQLSSFVFFMYNFIIQRLFEIPLFSVLSLPHAKENSFPIPMGLCTAYP